MPSLKGHLLIAAPELLAPIFARSVILMLEHSEEGAAGLILNRPTEATVASVAEQVFEQESDWQQPIRLGGPVPGPLVVLHAEAELSDQAVLPGVFSSVDADHVRELVRLRASPSLTIANYSGWGPGQLEGEIAEGSWLILPARPAHVFTDDLAGLWDRVRKEHAASRFARLLNVREVPEDPRWN